MRYRILHISFQKGGTDGAGSTNAITQRNGIRTISIVRIPLLKILAYLLIVKGLMSPVFAQSERSSSLLNQATTPVSGSIAGTQLPDYSSNQHTASFVPPPARFLNRQASSGRLAATAQFVVTYTNFPPAAQRAFQYAVDIWSTLLISPVPIRIQANWISDKPGLLGSAGPAAYRYGFDGAQQAAAFYPIALAEKIARRDLNSPTEPDIVANYNRNNEWYFGTDGKTPKEEVDMVTSVLHELAHGLGMIGFFDVVEDNGRYTAALPSVYDGLLTTAANKRLVSAKKEFPDNSEALKLQIAGNNLYIDGPVSRQAIAQKIRVSALYEFSRAASLYHLNEDTYPTGDPNSLMTPVLKLAEAIHSPGPMVLAAFADMEWKTTSVLHTPIPNSEDLKDLVFSTRIISDTTLIAGSGQLFYRKTAPTATDSVFTAVALTRVGTTDEYQFTLPANQAQGEIWYYFQARDASGRTFSNPGKQSNGAKTWYSFRVGPDTEPPVIRYSPTKYSLFSTTVADSLPIYARIFDSRSTVASARVEYQINGVAQPPQPLRYTRQTIGNATYDSIYVGRLDFPANSLKPGDKITYRLVAQDNARAGNQLANPVSGFYELTAVAQQPVRDQYINTFSDAASARDFAGSGFSIETPPGFVNPAIHSKHPYQNGTGVQLQSQYEYVLLSPIRLKANPDSAVIRFDEIVLVEPGEAGSRVGDVNFYDYVVVEGSRDAGHTWQSLVNPYSSNDKPVWETVYRSSFVPGLYGERNSTAVGVPALFRPREIPLLAATNPFKPGEQILIRFRLLADELANGWGWAIDNLRIQATPAPLVLAEEPIVSQTFRVSPNPVSAGEVLVEATFVKPTTEVSLTITTLTGQPVQQLTRKVSGSKLVEKLTVSQLPAGLYMVQLQTQDVVLTHKIVVSH